MPQVSLYLNETTYAKVRRAAETESKSISKWVSERIERAMAKGWPDGFDQLFGSIIDDSFIPPSEDSFTADAIREEL